MKTKLKQMGRIDMPDAMSTTENLPFCPGAGLAEECEGVRDDLNQIQGLLHDAIGKLSDNFQALESDSRQQLQLIESLMSGMRELNNTVDDDIDTISHINKNISDHVNCAVTVLQFEDLTQQLIAKIRVRIDRLEKTFPGLERQNSGESLPLLKADRIPCIVQEDMGAGSIELF